MIRRYTQLLGMTLVIAAPSVAMALNWKLNHPLQALPGTPPPPNTKIRYTDLTGTGDGPVSTACEYQMYIPLGNVIDQKKGGTTSPFGGWLLNLPANLTVGNNRRAQILDGGGIVQAYSEVDVTN